MVLAYWVSIQPSGLFQTWLPSLLGLYNAMFHLHSQLHLSHCNAICHVVALLIVVQKL